MLRIDPGASLSFISEKLLNEINVKLPLERLEEPIQIQTATGENINIKSKIHGTLSFERLPGQNIQDSIYILPGNLNVVLL